MKALILGLPGSGTSYFASLLSALGWSDAPPTFSIARYGYHTHESLMGRIVNRVAIGGAAASWPLDRWHAHYVPRKAIDDRECVIFSEHFVETNDAKGGDWYFKNPESLLYFSTIWNRFEWDFVIGVYRHPDESLKTLHSSQGPRGRRRSWVRWMRELLACSSVVVRFPQDADRLCDAIGDDMPPRFRLAKKRPRNRADGAPGEWARETWERLESARWEMG